MLFLVFQKDAREGFAGIQLCLTLHHIRTLAVPFADDSKEGDGEQDTDCVFCSGRFSEHNNGED